MKITLVELKSLTEKALTRYGYTPEETAIISEVLLYAQLRGNNQGVVKLIGAGIPKKPDLEPWSIVKESPASALIDAHQNHAMLVVNRAVDLALEKAGKTGVAIVGVRGINTSSGALGFYAKKIADAGFAGIAMCGSMETVAAAGSSQAIFGTNPFAIGVPSTASPLVFDMTTSSMAFFGVVEANTAGRQLPEDIAYDKEGNPTTSPADVLNDGALKAFDGSHKGSGISMMIQALTGPMMGAYFTGVGDIDNNWGGHLVVAFDPDLFAGRDALKAGVAQMIENVKNTKKLPGVEEIFVPGERGSRMTEVAQKSGEIEIEDNLYEELKKVAA